MTRLIVTADLHYNHAKSRATAEEVIDAINAADPDVLLVVGDTAIADGDTLEECLSRFRFTGPRLFVAGNHELWTQGSDSYTLFTDFLPRRVRDAGWQWLETEPYIAPGFAIVGTVGWYDYAFAPPDLHIPRRFYEHKLSPGAAQRLGEYARLLEETDDIPPAARDVVARWNDGKFVKLHRSDEAFLGELLDRLSAQLDQLRAVPTVVAAVHHLPFAELLPPPRNPQWDFVKAFLGSPKIGDLLRQHDNVRHVVCGHSHFPAEATIGRIHAVNIGSGYRWKTFQVLDLP